MCVVPGLAQSEPGTVAVLGLQSARVFTMCINRLLSPETLTSPGRFGRPTKVVANAFAWLMVRISASSCLADAAAASGDG